MQTAQSAKVGLLTDIHYDGRTPAMNRLYDAVSTLNRGGLDALVVMGDLINAVDSENAEQLLREVSALCGSFHGPVRYMPGNHDLDHLSKAEFYNALGKEGHPAHFHFEAGGYEFICIDGNFSPDGTEYDRGNFVWQESFVPPKQLEWLSARLAAAELPVIIVSHQRIDHDCIHAVANDAAVREVLEHSGKVKAVFQGHNHLDDLREIDGTAYYALSAHADGAGPAALLLDASSVLLVRDVSAWERD